MRRAGPGDAETIEALEQIALDAPWNRTQVQAALADLITLAWIAEHDGVGVGFALFQRSADELELLRLAVDPAWRRAGIGGELTARGLAAGAAEGIAACFLEVRVDNGPARRLYERLGFIRAGARARYYSDGADALIYRRPLGAPAAASG